MSSVQLSSDQWTKIHKFLKGCPDVYVGKEAECRRFIEAVLWMARSGAQWRLLPTEYGRWNSVYKRMARWSHKGIWERMHAHFIEDSDMESVIIDSTIVRAHACAGGAPTQKGGSPHRLLVAAEAASAPRCM